MSPLFHSGQGVAAPTAALPHTNVSHKETRENNLWFQGELHAVTFRNNSCSICLAPLCTTSRYSQVARYGQLVWWACTVV